MNNITNETNEEDNAVSGGQENTAALVALVAKVKDNLAAYAGSRRDLGIMIVLTFVNMLLGFGDASIGFAFSAFLPDICVRLAGAMTENAILGYVIYSFAVAMMLIYAASWFFCRMIRPWWLVIAFIVFAFDSLACLWGTFGSGDASDMGLSPLISVVFHAWVLYALFKGIASGFRLKKNLPLLEAQQDTLNKLMTSNSPDEFRKAAEQGDAVAQFNLGICYHEGNGVSADKVEAMNWFRKAAEQGFAEAQYNLGVCYAQNFDHTIEMLRKSAKQGVIEIQGSFKALQEMEMDLEEAQKWFRSAAEQGHAKAQNNLNEFIEQTEHNRKAIGQMRESLAQSQYMHGVAGGVDGTEDKTKEVAELGVPSAQCALGAKYMKGNGAEKNPEEAAKWFRKAAEQGDAVAQYNLGVCYMVGDGVAEDKAEAVKWFRKAAEQGLAEAQFNLGICYMAGDGVAEDKAEAVKWFRKAAEQGHAEAQYNMGVCYYEGIGVAKDKAEAAKWYRMAAEQGNVSAMKNLGAGN